MNHLLSTLVVSTFLCTYLFIYFSFQVNVPQSVNWVSGANGVPV